MNEDAMPMGKNTTAPPLLELVSVMEKRLTEYADRIGMLDERIRSLERVVGINQNPMPSSSRY